MRPNEPSLLSLYFFLRSGSRQNKTEDDVNSQSLTEVKCPAKNPG